MRSFVLLCLCCCAFCAVHAQQGDSVKTRPPVQRFYIGNGADGAIFSASTLQKTDNTGKVTNSISTLRFSAFLDVGLTFNFNFGHHFGVYTGIDVKNVGFIEQANGYTTKRRTYNAGIPVGIKVGNMDHGGSYFFLGGGADVPVNYKEKQFQIRSQKTKLSEWFSDRTPAVMPYVFAGICISGVTIKGQYYPNNFLNPDLSKNGVKPYAGYDVHLALLSFGYHLNYSKSPHKPGEADDNRLHLM